ncbi:MAG: pyridoxal phosphate-dependent aminotransferase [Rhizobiaceae bacterium]
MSLLDHVRREALVAPESGIVAVMNHGRKSDNVLPLWAGEGDLPTPDFIRDAAIEALAAGETFYTWQRGIPELRHALARYHARHFAKWLTADNFYVTGSGMQAIQLALQTVAGTGDEVIYLSPAWPNFSAAAGIAGAKAVSVSLDFSADGWQMDIRKLRSAVSGSTKAIFINSPSNPTGWTASRATLNAIVELARETGIWIIADEIYALFYYGEGRAASFMDVMKPDDRIIFVNSFSKNWAMTGWRIGWMTVHPQLGQIVENLIQYSTSGVAQFMQKAAVVALDHGDEFIFAQVRRAREARDLLCRALLDTGKVQLAIPEGAFYLYFKVQGVNDSLQAAFSMVDNAGIGIAPGAAFSATDDGWFRICFHRDLKDIEFGASKLISWLSRFA